MAFNKIVVHMDSPICECIEKAGHAIAISDGANFVISCKGCQIKLYVPIGKAKTTIEIKPVKFEQLEISQSRTANIE